jgi:hypothetical protein
MATEQIAAGTLEFVQVRGLRAGQQPESPVELTGLEGRLGSS